MLVCSCVLVGLVLCVFCVRGSSCSLAAVRSLFAAVPFPVALRLSRLRSAAALAFAAQFASSLQCLLALSRQQLAQLAPSSLVHFAHLLSAAGFREALAQRSTCVDSRRRFSSCNISWPAFKSLHRFAPCFAVVSNGCYAALAETSFSGCVVSSLVHVSQERRPLAVIFFGGRHYFCAGGSCSHLFSSFFAFL